MKTICLAGKHDIAVNILLYCLEHYEKKYIKCILNRNETGINSWQKSMKWFAEKKDVEIIELEDAYNIKDMIFLSLEFDQIIIPERFQTTELYNIHFSLLPKYKGCYTSILPILHDEEYTGVTLHKIRFGIDTGEIIAQEVVEIGANDTSLDLYKILIESGTKVVRDNLLKLINNTFTTTPQEKIKSTYYSRNYIDYSTLELEVQQTGNQVKNQIRAFNFRPYQLLKWKNVEYIDAVILDKLSEEKAGTVLEDNEVFTKIATIDYDTILYKDNFESLMEAIRKHDNVLAKKLCSSKQLIKAQDTHGWSALTVAVYNNNMEMARYLIDEGANERVLNNNGTNLLMYAKDCYLNSGDTTMFEYMLDLDLTPDMEDYAGKNLYDYCMSNHINYIGKFSMKPDEFYRKID